MRTSEQINEIAAALAKAQLGVKSALKDSFNPGFKSKYADLSAVKDAIGDCLSKNDIAVIQAHGILDTGQIVLSTRLMHKSGQWLESQYLIKPVKEDPQGYASATTYARRISLASMVGVVADEDDDGNAASQRGNYEPPARPAPKVEDKTAAAKSYVDEAIKAIGTLTDATSLNAWVEANKTKLERLRDVYDEGSRQVSGAILETRKALMRGAAE
jgi:enamine deaminase RidA (YjgF/YER057c/UK114 family)